MTLKVLRPSRLALGRRKMKLTLVVGCALVDADKRILIAQRPEGKSLAGLWEFPGGKVEPGERPEETLIRELQEEIGITVSEPCLAPITFASHAYATLHLLMPTYICRRWEGGGSGRGGGGGGGGGWARPERQSAPRKSPPCATSSHAGWAHAAARSGCWSRPCGGDQPSAQTHCRSAPRRDRHRRPAARGP